jgi:hypothetical protein
MPRAIRQLFDCSNRRRPNHPCEPTDRQELAPIERKVIEYKKSDHNVVKHFFPLKPNSCCTISLEKTHFVVVEHDQLGSVVPHVIGSRWRCGHVVAVVEIAHGRHWTTARLSHVTCCYGTFDRVIIFYFISFYFISRSKKLV